MPIFPGIVLSLLISAVILCLVAEIKLFSQAMRARSWSTTAGTIHDVNFVNEDEFRVDIKYSYEVKGARYDGSKISFGYDSSPYSGVHNKIYEKLKSANKIEVRFNPRKPGQSTLAYGANRWHFVMLLLVMTCLSIALGSVLLFTTSFAVRWLFMQRQSDARLLSRLVVIE